MIVHRFALLVCLGVLLPALAGGASAASPECPRWREAFASMPTKMVTLQSGAKTLALRVKSADTSERRPAAFSARRPRRSSGT